MATTVARAPITTVTQRVTRFHGARSPMLNLLAVVLLIGLLATLYMSASGRGTATTYRINALVAEQARLERENADLRVQVSRAQSLDRVQPEARQRLGMVPVDPTQVIYLHVPSARHAPASTAQGGAPT